MGVGFESVVRPLPGDGLASLKRPRAALRFALGYHVMPLPGDQTGTTRSSLS
jgi:hypothetical protein